MKKMVEVEVTICDICKKEETHSSDGCIVCDKSICFECASPQSGKFAQRVMTNIYGGNIGPYCCTPCFGKETLVTNAARVIIRLSNEYKGWTTDFNTRKEKAEEELRTLLKRS